MMKRGILKCAIQEAERSDHPIYQLGSVVFRGSRIFSSGHNSFRSSTIPIRYKRFEYTLHAEQSALLGLNWETLKGASILVIRFNISGNMSLGYPCKYCMKSIKHVGMKFLYYSTRDGEIKREKII